MNKGGGQYYPESVNTSPDQYSRSLFPQYQKIPDSLMNPMKKRTAYFQQRLVDNSVVAGSHLSYSGPHEQSKTQMSTLKNYDH